LIFLNIADNVYRLMALQLFTQKLIAATVCFTVGAITEMYTFSITNDVHKSTGFGFATIAVLFISGIHNC
jgi:hypothetical protein